MNQTQGCVLGARSDFAQVCGHCRVDSSHAKVQWRPLPNVYVSQQLVEAAHSWGQLPATSCCPHLERQLGLHYGLTEDIIVPGHNGDHIPSAEHNGRYIYIIITIYYSPRQSLGLCISPSIDALPPASRLHFPNDVSLTSTRNTKPRTTVGTFVIPQVTSSQVHSIYANCPASVFSAEYSNIQVPVLIRQWTRARRGARHKTQQS